MRGACVLAVETGRSSVGFAVVAIANRSLGVVMRNAKDIGNFDLFSRSWQSRREGDLIKLRDQRISGRHTTEEM